jgi:hypothetical protein
MQRQDTACRIKARSYGSFLPALTLLPHGEDQRHRSGSAGAPLSSSRFGKHGARIWEPVLLTQWTANVHPADRFTLFATAADELLTEHADKVADTDYRELAELIVNFVLDTKHNRAAANLREHDEWLSQFAIRLSARYLRGLLSPLAPAHQISFALRVHA